MFKKILTISLAAILVSCSSLSTKNSGKVELRPYQEKTLPNGLKLIFITDNSLPRLGMSVLVRVGALNEQKGQEGLNALTASLLEQGTKKRSALQLADDFGKLGSDLAPSGAYDFTVVATDGLSQFRSQLLDLFADAVMNSNFNAQEIERKRSQMIAGLTKLVDNPTGYADVMLDKEIFDSHPYAFPVSGTVESLRKITRAQILEHYQRYYVPGNTTLAVYGQIDDAFKAEVEKTFSAWTGKESLLQPSPAVTAQVAPVIKLYSKDGLTQTQIRIGTVGFERTASDFLPARLANVVLGGAFASRLNQKVRDELGLTYSISSSFEARKEKGPIEISTFTRNDKVGETVKNAQLVLKEFHDKGINEKELKAAKALLVGQFPASIETVDRYAFNLMVLKFYGIPETYLSNFVSNVEKVSLKEVNTAIQKYYKPEQFKVVVFADEKQVIDQLKALAPVQIEKLK